MCSSTATPHFLVLPERTVSHHTCRGRHATDLAVSAWLGNLMIYELAYPMNCKFLFSESYFGAVYFMERVQNMPLIKSAE